jgi:hypothetical protein
MDFKGGLTYLIVGMGVGIGAYIAIQQMRNGNMQNTIGNAFNKVKSQAQNKLGNMM